MDVADVPRPYGVAVLLVLAMTAAHREPDVCIESEGGYWAFGFKVAARGSVLAAGDRSAAGRSLVRIERVVDGRVTEEARIEVSDLYWLAVREDLVVARVGSSEVAFYTRGRSTWQLDQQLTIDHRCVATRALEPVLVDEDVLVVAGDDHSCIYEQVRNRWQLAEVLPRSFSVAMARDRVVLFDYIRSDVEIYVRRSGRWEHEATIVAPTGARLSGVATSRRWIVAAGADAANHRVLYVYDGDHENRLAAILPEIEDGYALAVSDSMIVATDQLWRFDGAAWSQQVLPTHGGTVAIGELIWSGAPGDDESPGRIYGYHPSSLTD